MKLQPQGAGPQVHRRASQSVLFWIVLQAGRMVPEQGKRLGVPSRHLGFSFA